MGVFEERVIRARLSRCDENRTHAAQSLELSRQALQVKLARWRDEELETTDKDKT